MKRFLAFIIGICLSVTLIGCAVGRNQGEKPPTVARPDLRPVSMQVELEHPGCLQLGDALGIRVWVENGGDVDAGTFTVVVNGVSQTDPDGLAAGTQTSLFFAGYEVYPQANTVVVDAENGVVEGDEKNNRLEENLPVPTPPAVCTPMAMELPDLVPLSMSYTFEHAQCLEPGAPLGVRLVLKNAGTVPAGIFTITVNGVQQVVQDGLAAGETLSVFFPGHSEPSQAEVDDTGLVEEVDETNNVLQLQLPVPTPPVPCTPTPSAYHMHSLFHPT